MLRLQGDEIYWYYNVTAGATGFASINSTALNVVAGTWYEFHARRSGTSMEIYVDGSSVASTTQGASFYNATHVLRVGASETGTSDEFFGQIADVQLFNSAQSTTVTTSKPAPSTEDFYLEHGAGPANMTLISNSQTADSAPTTARALVLYDPIATSTLNTDFTLEVSMDGGSTFSTAFTLAKNANYDSNVEIIESNTLTLDSTSGTSMVWQAKTLNNKEIRVHGVYLTWA